MATPRQHRGTLDEEIHFEIHFALGNCSLGSFLVATRPLGACAISLGDGPNTLIQELQARFPKASPARGNGNVCRFVARMVSFVEDPARGLDLPLDPRGTPFQQRVWQQLRLIPAGFRMSYSEIARRIGAPRAARAVAAACAANPLAVVIPCHRAIRTDGGLSGYRWGIARKAELLRREKDSLALAIPPPQENPDRATIKIHRF